MSLAPRSLVDSRAVEDGFRAYNFVQATDDIATSGVVPLDEFEKIANAGYERVINLLPDENQYAQPGEAATVTRLGMAYVHIPIDIERPTLEDYVQFRQAMEGAAGAPVWVHCAANWRVSAFVAVYAQERLGWSAERARAFVDPIWEPTEAWVELEAEILGRTGGAGG